MFVWNFAGLLALLWKCFHLFVKIDIHFLSSTMSWRYWTTPRFTKLKISLSLLVCHWNLNSLSAHNLSGFTQLKAYISLYKHDFTCLSETYLDSTISDSLFEIHGYNLVRADHPNNIKVVVEFVFTIRSHSLFEL